MARSEPEVLAHQHETCCHCQLRLISLHHQDRGHQLLLKHRGFRLRLGNMEQESDAAELAQTLDPGKDRPDPLVEDVGVELLQ